MFVLLIVRMAGLAVGAIIQQRGRSDLVAALVLAGDGMVFEWHRR